MVVCTGFLIMQHYIGLLFQLSNKYRICWEDREPTMTGLTDNLRIAVVSSQAHVNEAVLEFK